MLLQIYLLWKLLYCIEQELRNHLQFGMQLKGYPSQIPNERRSSYESQNVFKIIKYKKSKIQQMKKLERSKTNLYWVLSQKLERQLKQIKNHNTPAARQKHFLFQKCRNEKHFRKKTSQVFNQTHERFYYSSKSSLHRPTTCCSRNTKISRKISDQQRPKLKSGKENKQSNQVDTFTIQKRLEQIKNTCARENSKSQKIKEDINTVFFYQKLINKNSSLIFTKIL